MIPLTIKIDPLPFEETIIVRLNSSYDNRQVTEYDAILIDSSSGRCEFDFNGFSISFYWDDPSTIDGDIVMIRGGRLTANRIIRANSRHNTILITERCDQLCIMCSQPPKEKSFNFFDAYYLACILSPKNSVIGISGGEPTLYKAELFEMMSTVAERRPDISFHVLTNAQHFTECDQSQLEKLSKNVLWGVPIYSAESHLHNKIVGKEGAFLNLLRGLRILASTGSNVELRTVVMRSNADALERLGDYISRRFPFSSVWAIMQMENIGFGKKVWQQEFFDSSTLFSRISTAIDIMLARGKSVALYNFPTCTVPTEYRYLCVDSVSDWKKKWIEPCYGCRQQKSCCGFFQWYDHSDGFARIRPDEA